MKKIFKLFCFVLVAFISITSQTLAKYVSTESKVIWKTQFSSYTVSQNKDINTFIVGKSSDNESSLIDGNAVFRTDQGGGTDSSRWTNWYSSDEGRGKEAEIHLFFAKTTTISVVRLYHFIDHNGVDLPTSISFSYVNENDEVVELVNAPLTSFTRNFDVGLKNNGQTRSSIFRKYGTVEDTNAGGYYSSSWTNDIPRYNINGVDTIFVSQKGEVVAPYTEYNFGETVTTDTIIIKMQANENWYLGLIEIAMDWKFVDNSETSTWYSTFHPSV